MSEVKDFGKVFFAGLIDYAGLFPPTKLPLGEVVKNYREYLDGEDRFALSRCILCLGHIKELLSGEIEGDPLKLFSNEESLSVSFLSKDLEGDLGELSELLGGSGDSERVCVGSIETVLSEEVKEVTDLVALFRKHNELFSGVFSGVCGEGISIFYEVPAGENWEERYQEVVEALSEFRKEGSSVLYGIKLRCGGIENSLIPSVDRVAFAIYRSIKAGVPMKFTAGLHHPFRHMPNVESGITVHMHGYVNLFFTGFLAAKGVGVEEVRKVVGKVVEEGVDSKGVDSEDLPEVTEDGVSWLGHFVSNREIEEFRGSRLISYGSCSFNEPIEDAKRLTWL